MLVSVSLRKKRTNGKKQKTFLLTLVEQNKELAAVHIQYLQS